MVTLFITDYDYYEPVCHYKLNSVHFPIHSLLAYTRSVIKSFDSRPNIAQSVRALDFNIDRAVGGSILTAGKKLKNRNVTIRAIN